jgi:hypothetical protein
MMVRVEQHTLAFLLQASFWYKKHAKTDRTHFRAIMIFSKISFTVAAALLSVTSAIPTAAVADSDGVGISSRAAAVDVSDGVGISSRAAAVAVSDSVGVSSRALTFNNLLVILLENTDFSSAIADPNLKAFASSGVLFSNWLAVSHPSQPNYIALTSGSTNGVTSDTSTTINVKNIADLLEAKGLTWKSYQENLPSTCFLGTVSADGLYFRSAIPRSL